MRRLGTYLGKGLAKLGLGSSFTWQHTCAAAVLAVSLAGAAMPAGAQESERDGLRVTVSNVRSGTVVLNWRGAIMPPMAGQIREAFEAHKRQATRFVLRISSQGGLVPEGERVIELMRQIKTTHQLDTVVTQGDVCATVVDAAAVRHKTRMLHSKRICMFDLLQCALSTCDVTPGCSIEVRVVGEF